MIRLFVPNPLARDAVVVPAPDQAHYLMKVMRLAVGGEVLLFNGRDGEWRATVTEVGKRGCRLVVQARTREQVSPPTSTLSSPW